MSYAAYVARRTRFARSFNVSAKTFLCLLSALFIALFVSANVAAQTASKDNTDDDTVIVNVAGQEVRVNRQIGKIQPLTQDEARKLAAGVKELLNKSAANLEVRTQPDGTQEASLAGFPTLAVARINADGKLETECVTTTEAAAKFFGIEEEMRKLNAEEAARQGQTPVAPTAGKSVPANDAQIINAAPRKPSSRRPVRTRKTPN